MNNENFLADALVWAHQPSLEENDETRQWVKAIVKVRTIGGYEYAIARRGNKGQPLIVKSFSNNTVVKVESIFPYEYIEKEIIEEKMTVENKEENKVEERSMTKGELIAAIIKENPNEDMSLLSSMKKKELKDHYENIIIQKNITDGI